jgi:hypothetical protein
LPIYQYSSSGIEILFFMMNFFDFQKYRAT